ncbi:peptidoglycan-associated lipoprotein [Rhodovulum bhavnagarense]|uniref:Peptidoglycan-associated lipoprotein n=1 Tax=Rhodovulum bhavnagarense TaxID=992286 RepID=A0A4R2RFA0_9RHOB|nr:peptidoglycan-associated lipoprotein Pal [Rhodovulum bhavnagarense]TCP62252.1 peptidoglycan-associated lipoprotein [Rhodovulum bhavnagarense]
MTPMTKTLLLISALAVSACSNPGGAAWNTPGGLGAGAGGGAAGSVSDPTSVAYFQQSVGDRVLFAVDESTVSEGARVILQAQAEWLMKNPDYQAVIEGHADEQGTREYNLALGARRASAVQEFLVSRGVSPARLRTVTYGKERPIEICSAEACYAQNRRAVTVVTAGIGS